MPAQYTERYCAFVDILGFGQLIERLRTAETEAQTLERLLRTIHAPKSGQALDIHETDFRAQSISDAVAISTRVNRHGLVQLFNSLERLALDLLREGFFVRGAVVRNRLHHDDHMVFGEALVQAFHLERDVVHFPRIMIPSMVRDDVTRYLNENALDGDLRNRFLQADDGPAFLNVLRPVQAALQRLIAVDGDPEGFATVVQHYKSLRGQIQRRFDESIDNPRHFQKVQWFASYWNRLIPRYSIDGFAAITGAGLDPKPAAWGK